MCTIKHKKVHFHALINARGGFLLIENTKGVASCTAELAAKSRASSDKCPTSIVALVNLWSQV